MEKLLNNLPPRIRRHIVGIVGGVVLAAGIVMIPYPGPGWLVVFMGLAILSREFPWAQRALHYGRHKYDDWNTWTARQHWSVRFLTLAGTTVVVFVTIWLVNGYGLLNSWLHLDQPWLNSPFVR